MDRDSRTPPGSARDDEPQPALWIPPIPSLVALSRCTSGNTFEGLLAALAEQHSRDLAEAHRSLVHLSQENARLQEELEKLRRVSVQALSAATASNPLSSQGGTSLVTEPAKSPCESLNASAYADVDHAELSIQLTPKSSKLRDLAAREPLKAGGYRRGKAWDACHCCEPHQCAMTTTVPSLPAACSCSTVNTIKVSRRKQTSGHSQSDSSAASDGSAAGSGSGYGSEKQPPLSTVGRRRLGGILRAVTKPLTGHHQPETAGVTERSTSGPVAVKRVVTNRSDNVSSMPTEGDLEKSRKQTDENALLEQTVARLEQERRRRKREHFRVMFNMRGRKASINAGDLSRVMQKRGKEDFNLDRSAQMLSELCRLVDDMEAASDSPRTSPRWWAQRPKSLVEAAFPREISPATGIGLTDCQTTSPITTPTGRRQRPSAKTNRSIAMERARSGLFRTRTLSYPGASSIHMNFMVFVDLMLSPSLVSRIDDPQKAVEVAEVQQMLLVEDTSQVIAKVTHATTGSSDDMSDKDHLRELIVGYLNFAVSIAVVTSLVTLGVSLDVDPDWVGWLLIQASCTLIFVIELLIKVSILGTKGYFCKRGERVWNWADTLITLLSVVDLGAYAVSSTTEATNMARISLVLRSLRLVRIVRLVKLLRMPLFHELGSMLTGLLIGLPWLVWVCCLLLVVIFSTALVLRQAVGPGDSCHTGCSVTGDECMSDQVEELVTRADLPEDCKLHYLLGEEYFGTLTESMFTVFRCMIGDCTTRSGRALDLELSRGFGLRFIICYALGMVSVIFGLFNVVTALFVESTLSALKYNELQRKKARQYETRWVQQKLEQMIERIAVLQHIPRLSSSLPVSMTLSEDDLRYVLEDKIVRESLHDIDVVVDLDSAMYDMFEWDATGRIGLSDFITTIMKLRGDLQKTDMVASWVALRSLSDRFQEFQLVILANQRQMMSQQEQMLQQRQENIV